MDLNVKIILRFLILISFPIASFAQKDVTQFLDIPVDGFKPEMIRKLKSKGFTINKYNEDLLDGEFNGSKVNLVIGTNNNKVWRIAVVDVNPSDETNIKIRFNNLIQQFINNKRYSVYSDSSFAKYSIPEKEDISFEILVHKKRYEAVFYQMTAKYDSLNNEKERFLQKGAMNENEKERVGEILIEMNKEALNSLYKPVWFMIKEDNGEYRILIYYENEYNKANGEGL